MNRRAFHTPSWGLIGLLGAVLGAVLVAAPAAAELVEVPLQPGQSMDRQFTAQPAKFVEVCSKLGKGQTLDWQFDASGPTDFNIHYHLGPQVVYPARQSAVTMSKGRLEVPLDQDYCWMWTNPGAGPVTIRARITAATAP